MKHIERTTLALAFLAATSAASAQEVVRYVHLDAIGNVRVVSDQNNNVIERHDYLPFGEECTTGPCANSPGVGAGQPRKFTGKERDQETGLDYFGARYYGSRIARFTTIDPVYTWKENLEDPQRWNRYAYGRNNPLRYIDPDGRVIVAIDPADITLLTQYINSRAQGAFAFDANNQLQVVQTNGGAGYSQYYRDRLIDAIKDPDTINLDIAPSMTDRAGRTWQVDAQFGGGLTDGNRSGGTQTVVISGNPYMALKDVSGKPLRDDPADILAHELVGHAIPRTVRTDTGNAIDNENKVRAQVKGGGQRQRDPSHVE